MIGSIITLIIIGLEARIGAKIYGYFYFKNYSENVPRYSYKLTRIICVICCLATFVGNIWAISESAKYNVQYTTETTIYLKDNENALNNFEFVDNRMSFENLFVYFVNNKKGLDQKSLNAYDVKISYNENATEAKLITSGLHFTNKLAAFWGGFNKLTVGYTLVFPGESPIN